MKHPLRDLFWTTLIILLAIVMTLSVIAVYVFGQDVFLLFPEYGIPFFLVGFIIVGGYFTGAWRSVKSLKANLRVKPHVISKVIILITIIWIPFEWDVGKGIYYDWRGNIPESSPYDSYQADRFFPENMSVIYETIPGNPSAHCSSLVYLPNGDLLAAWFAGAGEKATDVAIWGSRCTPELNPADNISMFLNWSTPTVLADTVNQSEGQPVFYQCPDGRLILFYQTMRPTSPLFDTWGPVLKTGWSLAKIKMKESSDFGYTWTEPEYLRDDYFWVIRTALLQTSQGHVILPFHREALQYQSLFYINSDPNLEGKWSLHGRLRTPRGCLEPSIVELDNGRILCLLRTTDGLIYKAHSDDGGFHWTTPIPMRFPNSNAQVTILKISDGRVLVLCNPVSKNRERLSIIIGDPTGELWSEPLTILDTPGYEYSYPSLIELPDQTVVFSFTHGRRTIGWGRFNISSLPPNLTMY